MKCISCEYCLPDDVDPETLNVTYFCLWHKKEVNPKNHCTYFRKEELYYE